MFKVSCMSTIMAILEASPDGTVHLPVPERLRKGKIKIAATLEAVEPPASSQSEEMRKGEILSVLA